MRFVLFNTTFSFNERFTTDDTDMRQSSITRIGRMFCVAWSLKKGDWWKAKDEEKAVFFRASWRKPIGEGKQTGLFIGRLAFVIHSRQEEQPS